MHSVRTRFVSIDATATEHSKMHGIFMRLSVHLLTLLVAHANATHARKPCDWCPYVYWTHMDGRVSLEKTERRAEYRVRSGVRCLSKRTCRMRMHVTVVVRRCQTSSRSCCIGHPPSANANACMPLSVI